MHPAAPQLPSSVWVGHAAAVALAMSAVQLELLELRMSFCVKPEQRLRQNVELVVTCTLVRLL
jgi:hypothetical protein